MQTSSTLNAHWFHSNIYIIFLTFLWYVSPCYSLFFSRDHLRSPSEIISGPGSFVVQSGDYLRSRIICGPGILRTRTARSRNWIWLDKFTRYVIKQVDRLYRSQNCFESFKKSFLLLPPLPYCSNSKAVTKNSRRHYKQINHVFVLWPRKSVRTRKRWR